MAMVTLVELAIVELAIVEFAPLSLAHVLKKECVAVSLVYLSCLSLF